MAGLDGGGSVQFGSPDVGSPFEIHPPPFVLHDSSANAQFNLVPRTTVISAGESVTFTIGGPGATVPHQVAVCALGVGPGDVNTSPNGTSLINDVRCPRPEPAPKLTGPVAVAFPAPGRYLVLCNIRGHFTNFDMYGWVNVK